MKSLLLTALCILTTPIFSSSATPDDHQSAVNDVIINISENFDSMINKHFSYNARLKHIYIDDPVNLNIMNKERLLSIPYASRVKLNYDFNGEFVGFNGTINRDNVFHSWEVTVDILQDYMNQFNSDKYTCTYKRCLPDLDMFRRHSSKRIDENRMIVGGWRIENIAVTLYIIKKAEFGPPKSQHEDNYKIVFYSNVSR